MLDTKPNAMSIYSVLSTNGSEIKHACGEAAISN